MFIAAITEPMVEDFHYVLHHFAGLLPAGCNATPGSDATEVVWLSLEELHASTVDLTPSTIAVARRVHELFSHPKMHPESLLIDPDSE